MQEKVDISETETVTFFDTENKKTVSAISTHF